MINILFIVVHSYDRTNYVFDSVSFIVVCNTIINTFRIAERLLVESPGRWEPDILTAKLQYS